MRTIHTTNSRVITYLSSYSSWWPSSLKIKTFLLPEKLIGARIEVRPYGGKAFYCEVVDMNDAKTLTLRYSGIYSGTGIWTISEINGKSRVTYKIELKIQSKLISLLSFVLPLGSIHSKLMEQVLTGLEKHLCKIENAPNNRIHPMGNKACSW